MAAVAAQCLTWSGWRRWEPVMRYGRLFTPGTDAVSDRAKAIQPMHAGREAYRMAVDSGLLYAEGYATYLRRGGVPPTPWAWAWCLDGETVLAPPAIIQGTAFFGVALRPQYMRRVHAAQCGDDGGEGFLWAFTRGDREIPPLDPATDITLDLGRDIPPSVREWALTAERHPGPARRPPDWVVTELLGAGPRPVVDDPYRAMRERLGARPVGHDPLYGLFAPAPDQPQVPGTAPSGPYSRYMVRRADWLNSGMALQCSGKTGGAYSDDGEILGMIQDGDSVATLMRMADEHRPRCEWAVSPGDERDHPELTAQKHAEVHLKWATGSRAKQSFAVLHRLDYNVWDAWLHPAHRDGQVTGEEPPVRLTRNGVSYEMALTAAFRAMGEEMPEGFAVVYLPFELPAEQRPPSRAPLPMSYARYLIRSSDGLGSGLQLHCSGRTGSVNSDDGAILEEPIQDGDSLDTLIRMADEHRPRCEWAVCPADERERPELTVEKRAKVHLKWRMGYQAEKDFAVLHRLDHKVWDAWLHPSHLEGHRVIREPPALLTGNGVSYEMSLAAVFRAMGEQMPEKFGVFYLYDQPKPDAPGA